MSPFTCTREKELAEALRSGRWPEGCSQELRNHVVACRSCSDLALITGTLQSARTTTAAVPRLEAPGVLWWRAQLRRRNAALERIEKPILGAQLFAFAVILAVSGVALVSQARQGFRLASWLENMSSVFHFESLLPASFAHGEGGLWILVPVLATIALLGGVVVYLASEKQ
jgi:hypothetical protein